MSDDEKAGNYAKIGGDTDGFAAIRAAILQKMLARAAFDGWTELALRSAAQEAGAGSAALRAAFPKGVADALRTWSAQTDSEMLAAIAEPGFANRKIREKVAFAIKARLNALRIHKEAARRASATLALPHYAPLGAELAWNAADVIWRGIGDTSTDFNYYSKRTILAGVWTSTLMRWLSDETVDESATNAFLDARMENVMQVEKAKSRIRNFAIDPIKPIEWLAKLRYPARNKNGAERRRAEQEAKIDETLDESFPASDPPYWTP
ncbi:COQ9 family protein [Hyphococcus sp.]|uniref:COQ9 family protein n=1 Tax=Hyphococcus sp. TaxID=2038636 RepID=UPI003CCBAD5A